MKINIQNKENIYSGLDKLPEGNGSDEVTEGCLVLEGGAFRAVYEEGVLDALMKENINMACTVGVSAGAMNGMHYVTGQIGRAARINLRYRHDKRYVGRGAVKNEHGIIGFDFVFHKCSGAGLFDSERFFGTNRRFVAVATNCRTGKAAYFEKGKCDIFRAIQASASMPCCSRMVWMDGEPYLDGGCSDSLPYEWALKQNYKKIIVVKTRDIHYRKEPASQFQQECYRMLYHKYPAFVDILCRRYIDYNRQCAELEKLEKEGKVYVICPKIDMGIGKLEPDTEKLGKWYWQGYEDTMGQIDKIRKYLSVN